MNFFRNILIILLVLLLGSCCRRHFLAGSDQIMMRSPKLILEARGDTVPFEIRVKVPPGTLCRGMTLELTPCLKTDSLRTVFLPYTIGTDKGDTSVYYCGKGEELRLKGWFMNFAALQDSWFVVEWKAVHKGKEAPMSERLLGYGISQFAHYARGIMGDVAGMDAAQTLQYLEGAPGGDAETWYQRAVMSARMLDGEGARDHLAEALKLRPELSLRLKGDVEFIYFRNTDWYLVMTGSDQGDQ